MPSVMAQYTFDPTDTFFTIFLALSSQYSLLAILTGNTNPDEGKLIAFKICQHFANIVENQNRVSDKNIDGKSTLSKLKLSHSTSPFIYLTTHFLELTKLSDDFLNISNLYLDAEEKLQEGKLHLSYKHKVMEGVTPIKGYGLALARTVRFPRNVLHRAEQIYEKLLIQEKNKLENQDQAHVSTRSHLCPLLEETLKIPTPSTQLSVINKSLHTVAGFLNKTMPRASETTPALTAEKNGLAELTAELYDIFAQIISSLRNRPGNYDESCNSLIKGFIERQSYELIDAIYKIDSKEFEGIVKFDITSKSSSSGKTSTSTVENVAGDTDLLDLSYHSLIRRLGCNPNHVSLGSFNTNSAQTSPRNQIELDEWVVSPCSGLSGNFNFQTPIVQTCPSFLQETIEENTNIVERGYYTFPQINKTMTLNDLIDVEREGACNAMDFLELQNHDRSQAELTLNISNNIQKDTRNTIQQNDFIISSFGSKKSQSKLQKISLKSSRKMRTVWRKK